MKIATSTLFAISAIVVGSALITPAHAFALRTFVASTGSDANTATSCPATAPCRTLAAAFGVTTSNGEITIVDAGGYGSLTINRPVAIIGTAGALIGVPAGGTGITITAGASDVIIIRDILFSGAGLGANTGISLNGGKLVIENVTFRMLQTGLSVTNSKASVTNSNFTGNATAVVTNGTGVDTGGVCCAGPTWVAVYGVSSFTHNGTVFNMVNPGKRPDPATDNKITIFVHSFGSPATALIAGNTTTVTGTGTGCGCQSFYTLTTQTGNTAQLQ